MSSSSDPQETPSVDEIASSMLFMYGAHDDDDDHDTPAAGGGGPWAKARDFSNDPAKVAEITAASRQDRERYLNDGLTRVECRYCRATVDVKKLQPSYTAVQWNSNAAQQCAHFAELRAAGADSSRTRSCPKMADSIKHAVAEGLLSSGDDD